MDTLKIAVINQKGGAGKSTLAINLAVAADSPRLPAALVDCDNQETCRFWSTLRDAETPIVRAAGSRGLEKAFAAIDVSALIIDTPAKHETLERYVAQLADIVVVPTAPDPADIAALPRAQAILEEAGALERSLLVLNRVHPNAQPINRTREMLDAFAIRIPLLERPWLAMSAAYASAYAEGLGVTELTPPGRAAGEISALWREIERRTST